MGPTGFMGRTILALQNQSSFQKCLLTKLCKGYLNFFLNLKHIYNFLRNRNMEKRAYQDVPANGNTFASVFLATESSILQCFLFTDSFFFRSVKNEISYTFTALDSS